MVHTQVSLRILVGIGVAFLVTGLTYAAAWGWTMLYNFINLPRYSYLGCCPSVFFWWGLEFALLLTWIVGVTREPGYWLDLWEAGVRSVWQLPRRKLLRFIGKEALWFSVPFFGPMIIAFIFYRINLLVSDLTGLPVIWVSIWWSGEFVVGIFFVALVAACRWEAR